MGDLFKRREKIISPGDLEPIHPNLKIVGTFNTAATRHDGHFYYAVRVVAEPENHPEGVRLAPRFENANLKFDSIPVQDIDTSDKDPRQILLKTGQSRLPFISYLEIMRSKDGFTMDPDYHVRILPEGEGDEYGIEDCRIASIDGNHYLTYTAVTNGKGGDNGVLPVPNLITTKDFTDFERHGKIFEGPDKNVVLFPEKVNGQYVALHRPDQKEGGSNIVLAQSTDLKSWSAGSHLSIGGVSLTDGHRGAGAPPIKIEEGWLAITHQKLDNPAGTENNSPFIYQSPAFILDKDDPSKIIASTDEPFMKPEESFEKEGYFGNVVFPTGAIMLPDDELYICYGAADEFTGAAIVDVKELKQRMKPVGPAPAP